jgi:hypothetical protein
MQAFLLDVRIKIDKARYDRQIMFCDPTYNTYVISIGVIRYEVESIVVREFDKHPKPNKDNLRDK